MRKIVALFIMISAVTFYIVHMVNVGTTEHTAVIKKEKSIEKQLKEYEEKLEKNYPSEPIEVIAVYNKLLELAYKNPIKEREIEKYVDISRLMYSEPFKKLNPVEIQKKHLKEDLAYNQKNKLDLVTSSIGTVYVLEKNAQGKSEALVTVHHVMNASQVERQYMLIKEEDKWKINGWESKEEIKMEE